MRKWVGTLMLKCVIYKVLKLGSESSFFPDVFKLVLNSLFIRWDLRASVQNNKFSVQLNLKVV